MVKELKEGTIEERENRKSIWDQQGKERQNVQKLL